MKISIIGAGAGVGLEAVKHALAKGYQVTALSLDLSTLPDHSALKKVKGSATSVDDVRKAIADTDAILITVGTKSKKATTLFSSIAQTLVTVHEQMQFKAPVIVISGFGVGESRRYASLFIKLVIRFFLKDQYEDKARMEAIFEQSNLRSEMVQPGMLTNGPLTKHYQTFETHHKEMKVGKISREDLAFFMVQEATEQKMISKKVAITAK